MVKRSQPPDPPLSIRETHESARAKLQERIKKAQQLKDRQVQSQEEAQAFNKDYDKWDDYNETLLRSLFTNDVPVTEYVWSVSLGTTYHPDSPLAKHRRNLEAIDKKSDHLESLVERVELIPLAEGVAVQRQPTVPRPETDRVFLVHGHDAAARETVARFLEHLGLSPVVLHELPSGGKTIIEKLEHHSDVDFAVVLLTPDDEGLSHDDSDLRPRARQNVLLELGFFVGRLGRDRVCALHKGSLELPTDILGVVYVRFDEGGDWPLRLARELKQAGFAIDMNQIV
jgi:predicted nucleotide-binding protein